MAIEDVRDSRVLVSIPAGGTIKVVTGPKPDDRMVDVLWEGRIVMMFTIDLQQRGEEIAEASGIQI